MTLSEIRKHLKNDLTVCWSNDNYEVRLNSDGDLIVWHEHGWWPLKSNYDLGKCYLKD